MGGSVRSSARDVVVQRDGSTRSSSAGSTGAAHQILLRKDANELLCCVDGAALLIKQIQADPNRNQSRISRRSSPSGD